MKPINSYYSSYLTISWKHFPFPWIVFVISLLITLWIWQMLQSSITQANYEQFELRLERVKAAIIHRIHAYEHVLRGGVAVFAMMPHLGREAWHLYISQLQNREYYPGILAVGFSQQITDAEKSQHIDQLRVEGFSDYAIHPQTQSDFYMPLIYLEPLTEQHKRGLGFDAYSEPNRHAAIEKARDSGQATMTNKLVLVIEKPGETQPGVVLYLPVYRQGQPLETVAQRRQAFLGVVSGGFRMKDLMQNILGKSQLDINFAIYDGPQVQANNLLYQDSFTKKNYQPQFEKLVQVEIEGRTWTLSFSTLPKFDQDSRRHAPNFVLFGGLFVSFLLFVIIWSLTTTQHINTRLQSEIGERKSIEYRLRTQEELLRLVIDSIPQFIFWKDLNNIYLGCNRRFALMVGINEPASLVGKTDEQLVWPLESTLAFRSLDQRIIQTDQPEYHRIETLQHDDGGQKWFDTSRIPLHDSEGEVMGILVTFEDITEQKLAELELQRSRAAERQANIELNQFKTTLDLTLDGVFIREAADFKFSYVNQGMTNLLGYSKEELITMTPIDINPEMSSQRLSQLLDSLRGGSQKATTFTADYRHKTGQLIPVEVFLQYIEVPGQDSRFIGIARDITERKQAEARLQQAFADIEQAKMAAEIANVELNQFKTTLDMTLDVVLMRDVKTSRFTYANHGAVKKLGYTQEEILQMTPLDLNPEMTVQHLQELMTESQIAKTFETVVRHKNGTLIPVELFVQYIELPGQISRFISIGRDITERKQTEKALLAAKEAAEQARVEAEIANRAKSTFLANMSHELRTPLNGILGYTQILSRDKTLSEKQLEGINIIQRSGDYLLTLINDILDLSKIEAGKIEIYPVDFHFGDFIQGIVELFEMRAKQKGIAFNYKPLSHLPVGIHSDEKRLRQILINLIGNAIKFTDKGGVSLKVGYHEHKIRFQVEDTGVGIPVSELEKIFLPFQQVGDQNSRAQGTGLGLSITKKLVEMMGGELLVESTVGKGSLFWFALTLPDASHLIKKEHQQTPVIIGFEGTSCKILVVDDSWENRSVLNNLLTPLGFEIIEAANGLEGLNKVTEIKPDLIITDLVMSAMDGFEMTRRVKKIPAFSEIPVIAASASVFEMDQQQSIEAGCNDFIAKPIRADVLLEKLQAHLNLTWIYENVDEQDENGKPGDANLEASIPYDDIVSQKKPSKEQAKVLFDLAMMGDINGIVEEVNKLEKTDKQLGAFCNQIRQLAKNFEEEKICQLVEQYMG
jgi:PAS domain S-box-containing protein